MGDHLCIDGQTGTFAVWTGATDLGPVFNPAAHPTRTRFNSQQENIGFLATPRNGTYTNTVWPAGANSRKITLFAHGQSYRPFLMGWIGIAGRELPINGSVLHFVSGQAFYAYTIGADANNVYLNIMRSSTGGIGAVPSPATISYSISLSVYGVNANGTIRRPPYFNGVDVDAGAATPRLRAGYFDTTYRYPYRNAAGLIAAPNGATISAGIGWTGSVGVGQSESVGLGWRYSVLGHTVQRNAASLVPTIPGAVGNNAAFVASVTRMSL